MKRKYLAFLIFSFFALLVPVFAQDEGIHSAIDYKVSKMQKELQLTDVQVDAIRPIIKDYMTKREAVLKEASTEGVIDHQEVESTLQGLKSSEYKQLGKVLDQDQLEKLINKDRLLSTMNPDRIESADDEDATITPEGANFKF